MGSPADEAGRGTNETEHNVSLTRGFYLGKYEVTQAQYEAVMTGVTGDRNATPSNFHGNTNRPVEMVSWDDAQVFLTRLNQQRHSSARWMDLQIAHRITVGICLRAGTTTAYSWGNAIVSTNANFNQNISQTSNVGNYSANPWGFFDMHGNVFEWVNDFYSASYPNSNPIIDPSGPSTGTLRIYRGGNWAGGIVNVRSAKRISRPSNSRYFGVGFRVGFQKNQ